MTADLEQELRSIGKGITPPPGLDARSIARIQRRRGASVLTASCVLLVLGAGITMSVDTWRDSDRPNKAAPAGRSHTPTPRLPYSGHFGLSYDVRAGWDTSRSLTPRMDVGYQLVAAGTGPLPKGGRTCPMFPVRAIEAMRPQDAFFDLTRDPFREGRYFPPRPADFRKVARGPIDPDSELQRCISNPDVQKLYWLPFQEHGMFFHLLIAEGKRVSPKITRQLWHSVNGFVISGSRT